MGMEPTSAGALGALHDLVLGETAMGIRVHGVQARRVVEVLDEAEVQWSSAVLVALELGNRRLGCLGTIEADYAAAARAPAGLVLDLGLLHPANGGEKLNKVVVARRPRKLVRNQHVSQ